jgi:hypothetical protein
MKREEAKREQASERRQSETRQAREKARNDAKFTLQIDILIAF